MKKYASLLLLIVLALTLTACGDPKEPTVPVSVEPTTTADATPVTADATPVTTEQGVEVQPTQASGGVDLAGLMASYALDEENMMPLMLSDLEDFYGIAAADVKQFQASVSYTGLLCDEIVLVEATDADAAARVATCLENRYRTQANSFRDYLPEQYAILTKGKVQTDGLFVSLILGPDAAQWTEMYQAAIRAR